ncbi:MAG: esterase [Planctomycetota bacterium]
MAAFVLVPGAWHGGWCWQRLIPLLRAAGHAAYGFTLTGLGERSHLAAPEVGLETHVRDVLGLLEWEDLREVVLVGHSYAGIVACAAASRAPQRMARVVILDGFVAEDGRSLADQKGPDFVARSRDRAKRGGCDWLVPPPDNDLFGVEDAGDRAWLRARLTPHPLRSFLEPARLDANWSDGAMGRTFIQCRWPQEKVEEAPLNFERLELTAGHDPMITAPSVLAGALLKLT